MGSLEEKIKYSNAFNQLNKIGPKNFEKIESYFDSLKDAWNAPVSKFKKAGIGGEKTLSQIEERRSSVYPDESLEGIREKGIEVLIKDSPAYPKSLKEIPDPPFVLYVKGSTEALSGENIAIVGTRSYSNYGKEVTPYLARKLIYQGFTIVSGLAKGIDTFAHRTCVEESSSTVAVLATGPERIYPRSNSKLAKKIIKADGAIITENPPGTEIKRYLFPLRNRIISGLSFGTLVVEAGKKSGALITANQALEQNREVFAVPGDIFSTPSKGTNKIIKQGAKLTTSVDDILEEFNIEKSATDEETRRVIPENKDEEKILNLLEEGSLHVDKIIKETDLDSQTISSVLTTMTVKGKVKEMGGGIYGLKR